VRLLRWLAEHDRGFAALRRAARAAIVMPAMFALGEKVIGNPVVATFAAFGSFAMLLLVDFTGPMRDRLRAYLGLALAGAVFVCLGTLASSRPWLAAASMTCVAFAVLFVGVVSSELANAAPALLLAFILPVSLNGSASQIPDRLAGWGLASMAALVAVTVLWPAPSRDSLREPATAACRALAARLRSDVAYLLGGADAPSETEHDKSIGDAETAITALHEAFLATPYRPTGLSTATRTVVRLVDEIGWLGAVIQTGPRDRPAVVNRAGCAVKSAAATVLERGADLLAVTGGPADGLQEALGQLRHAVATMERAAAQTPLGFGQTGTATGEGEIGDFVSALDPTFRAQELAYAVSQIASNIDLTASAERRSWLDRMLGRQPRGVAGTLAAAQQRATAHVQRGSVWLHNSVRGAVGLGLAVLVANLSGVQHSFWVVLGTLSVLRSNALSTGQNAAWGLLGTAAGFVAGAVLLVPVGSNTTILWCLLPLAILVAGVLPAAISFTAGQAGFTVTLVILFNIIAPAGWRVGLLRVEDVALGCAVSLVVGLLFWPRGAAAALGRTLADAYRASSRYLAEAVAFGMQRCESSPSTMSGPPTEAATLAAAASRRLDDAFRSYLAERGTKPTSLAEMTSLVNGVAGLRLAADAVLDLWQRDDGDDPGDRTAARAVLLANTELIVGWYDELAGSLDGRNAAPEPLAHDDRTDDRLMDALRHDLLGADGRSGGTAARMMWTGDYLDAIRRLQAGVSGSRQSAGIRG
jgi:uncharacterized membrane protein YccC